MKLATVNRPINMVHGLTVMVYMDGWLGGMVSTPSPLYGLHTFNLIKILHSTISDAIR